MKRRRYIGSYVMTDGGSAKLFASIVGERPRYPPPRAKAEDLPHTHAL